MNDRAPWLPIGHKVSPTILVGRTVHTGRGYQIVDATGGARRLLLAEQNLLKVWTSASLVEEGHFVTASFGNREFVFMGTDSRALAPASVLPPPSDVGEAEGFAIALRRTHERMPNSDLASALYCERLAALLPTPEIEEPLSPDVVLGRYLTGGVQIPSTNVRRIVALMPWLSEGQVARLCERAGLEVGRQTSASAPNAARQTAPASRRVFALKGRSDLEAFFREHVIEIVENLDRYKNLGVEFPGGIVLHGPPGCGKTFAVERLVEYLDWPCFEISSGSIGSPYIHETGRKIAETFEQAVAQAPSAIVIDEMEAFLADREAGGGHRVEEVAEFLRRIPMVISKHVLVIGTTNRLEVIDPAILRRGRFDHIIEVAPASEEEVRELLEDLLAVRPCASDLDVDAAVQQLMGRPLSDVSFIVREAARISARSGREQIEKGALAQALDSFTPTDASAKRRGIGFL